MMDEDQERAFNLVTNWSRKWQVSADNHFGNLVAQMQQNIIHLV